MKRVMVFGTFDFFHLGHLQLFRQAKKHGEYLIAVIARDNRVARIKGKKPVHSEAERRDLVRNIRLVNKAVLGDTRNVYAVLKKYQPDVIALGYDQHAFVDGISTFIQTHRIPATVVRLKPYKPTTHKSTAIKSHRAKKMV